MTYRNPRYLRVIYYDDDNKTFGVSGITTSEDSVLDRTEQLREQGRNVRFSTTEPLQDISKVPSVEQIIAETALGYTYDSSLYW